MQREYLELYVIARSQDLTSDELLVGWAEWMCNALADYHEAVFVRLHPVIQDTKVS
jgi:hypothetical protein